MSRLAVFDLDNTLLTGDCEVLWVNYLLRQGLLDDSLAAANAEMDRRYREGLATSSEFTAFYASTFEGRSPSEWAPWVAGFFADVIRPRISTAACKLVQDHRDRGDTLLLSTAANRTLAQPTADMLGFEHVIATELGVRDDGVFSGAAIGTLNMREGKVERLRQWLAVRGDDAGRVLGGAVFYTDSINDLPLLLEVGEPIAVDPDARLAAIAQARGWRVLQLDRSSTLLST